MLFWRLLFPFTDSAFQNNHSCSLLVIASVVFISCLHFTKRKQKTSKGKTSLLSFFSFWISFQLSVFFSMQRSENEVRRYLFSTCRNIDDVFLNIYISKTTKTAKKNNNVGLRSSSCHGMSCHFVCSVTAMCWAALVEQVNKKQKKHWRQSEAHHQLLDGNGLGDWWFHVLSFPSFLFTYFEGCL